MSQIENINLIRARSNFIEQINKIKIQYPAKQNIIEQIEKYFENKVIISDKFIQQNNNEEYYKVSKLIEACKLILENIQNNENVIDNENIIENIINIYNNLEYKHQHTNQNENLEFQQLQNKLLKEITENDNSEVTLNLINYIKKDYLTIEGKRMKGILPPNFDVETQNEEECQIENEKEINVIIEYDTDNYPVLKCPGCYSTSLVVENDKCICLDCELISNNYDLTIGDRLK